MEEIVKTKGNGLNFCAKYAFKPNQLKYCGPSNERTLFEYASTGTVDQGLIELLEGFETMYPYLRLIARANAIRDPFDKRVVEAYWIGNELLNKVEMNELYMGLLDDHHLKKRLKIKYLNELLFKIPLGAKPHHSFHVLNIFIRTGKNQIKHTLSSMEKCLISSGQVKRIERGLRGEKLIVEKESVGYKNGSFLIKKEIKRVDYKFKDQGLVDNIKAGDKVALHWDFVCDKLNSRQAKRLESWNRYHLKLANLTI